jgi:H+/Cl- antiporter ClcA
MEGDEGRQLPLAQLALLALGLGVVTGIGAVLFRDLIGFIHNLFFTGRASLHYDANVFTAPAPWGILVILVPVLGAIGVTFLVTNFAPRPKDMACPRSWMRSITKAASSGPWWRLSNPWHQPWLLAADHPSGAKGPLSRSDPRSVRH